MKDKLSLGDLRAAVSACVISGDLSKNRSVERVSIDSRTLAAGDFFIAVKGKKFDGADFLSEAEAKGALGALVAQGCSWRPKHSGFVLLSCDDTVRGLGKIAKHWRAKFSIRVIGVTGSTGKSTTKEYISHLLSHFYPVLKSQGSFNNAIGLPLTLLQLTPQSAAVVLELGTNHQGEIAELASIASPNAGIITRIDPAHLSGLGTLAEIAIEKGALFRALPPEGIAVVNVDDEYVLRASNEIRLGKFTYSSRGNRADLAGEIERDQKRGYWKVYWNFAGQKRHFPHPVFGRHHAENLVAALAVAHAIGLDPAELESISSPLPDLAHRLSIWRSKNIVLIDDCYNANPASMRAALDQLMEVRDEGSRVIAVLGTMNELGETSRQRHEEIGKFSAELSIDCLIGVGKGGEEIVSAARSARGPQKVPLFGARARGSSQEHFSAKDPDEAILLLERVIDSPSTLLVKGSRSLEMEKIVKSLKERYK
ncbi:MAG: UDP-N-acetylmuramoyl-tripeptide--D-alanyl-D-alanine ligase [Deltaproteobacteria bacterium]|nr:UDP-N-acetylmuramoyl-tripeptide--D-alanyl-D-alanine ligase [Deltaproteobacteria bacterium]